MLEKFIFENHLGQMFNGLENGVFLNYNDLRDYSWEHELLNNKISRFYQSTTEKKLPLVIKCKDVEKATEIKNRLCDMAEADIYAKSPGKIFIGEYYIKGYIKSSKKAEYLIDKSYCTVELTLICEKSQWMREQTHRFTPDTDPTIGAGHGTDYPYDYPYDYAISIIGRRIPCDSISGCDFKLLIYGAAVNPAVTIGGHTYAINGSLSPGETLLIDSAEKTITLTTETGRKVNWFSKRSRKDYIFQPIPNGMNTVSWGNGFGFDLTVIEKRSEPRWT